MSSNSKDPQIMTSNQRAATEAGQGNCWSLITALSTLDPGLLSQGTAPQHTSDKQLSQKVLWHQASGQLELMPQRHAKTHRMAPMTQLQVEDTAPLSRRPGSPSPKTAHRLFGLAFSSAAVCGCRFLSMLGFLPSRATTLRLGAVGQRQELRALVLEGSVMVCLASVAAKPGGVGRLPNLRDYSYKLQAPSCPACCFPCAQQRMTPWSPHPSMDRCRHQQLPNTAECRNAYIRYNNGKCASNAGASIAGLAAQQLCRSRA